MNKVKVIAVTLNEFGEEKEKVIKQCKDIPTAEEFISEHEQDFADNPDAYYMYIQE